MSLGPQCHSCRKRRVRCDSKQPTCLKCIKAGITCPGYGKTFTWVGGQKTRRGRQKDINSNATEAACKEESQAIQIREKVKADTAEADEIIFPSPKLDGKALSGYTREESFMLESIRFYNTAICPDLTAIRTNPNIHQVTSQVWSYMDPLLRQITTCMARHPMQARLGQEGKNRIEDEQQLMAMKSNVLNTLNKRIRDEETRTDHLTIAAVLMFIFAEITVRPDVWTIHFNGALQLLKLKGGFASYLEEMPGFHALLWSFMITDVMSCTTCNSRLIASEDYIRHQMDYIECIPDLHEGLDATGWVPCPTKILHAIILVNMQRARLQLAREDKLAGSIEESQDEIREGIKAAIKLTKDFSAEEWGISIEQRWRASGCVAESPCQGRGGYTDTDAGVDSWATLGESYRSAAVLYLVRTLVFIPDVKTQTSASSGRQVWPCSALSSEFASAAAWVFAESAQKTLLSNLRALIGKQLEKVALWPLFIAGFEALHSTCQDDDEEASNVFAFATKNLERLGRELGSGAITEASAFLHRSRAMANKQSSHVEQAERSEPLWDRAFGKRYIFVI